MIERKRGSFPTPIFQVGFGTSQVANTDHKYKGVKYIPVKEARGILRVAFDLGVNFFDTSPTYGNAETLVGELKAKHKEKIIVATKSGLSSEGIRNFSLPRLEKEIEISRKCLNVECLDVFQLTKPSISDLEDGELFAFLGELKSKGRCRYTGVIMGDINTGYQCIESGQVDCLQVLYHLLYQDTENLISEAKRKGLGIIVRSPLSSGLLTGNYTVKTKFDSNDSRSNYFSGVGFERRLKILHGIQKDLNISNQELMGFSLRFILSNPGVSVVVPAASNAEQVRRLVSIGEGSTPFSPDELVQIKNTVMRYIEGVDIVVQN
jgi:aryl-alcohol dehydrogenase-like predicted oxidoreductase